jgi:hypothetical protein
METKRNSFFTKTAFTPSSAMSPSGRLAPAKRRLPPREEREREEYRADKARLERQRLEQFLEGTMSFAERQSARLPPRRWFVQGMVCPGFNLVTGKKAMGKSFFLTQMANAIGEGGEFLGRETSKAKVLLVSFELDEVDMAGRFKSMERLSENAYIVHGWSSGEQAFTDVERAIKEFRFNVIMFDTFLPMLPKGPEFNVNEYGDTGVFLRWRMLAKRHGAAIVASWHEGKSKRDDFMLNAIGSTGMVAQADSVLSIERKRGDEKGKVLIAGNHAKDAAIPVVFVGGVFSLAEGSAGTDCLTLNEEKTIAALGRFPGEARAAEVAEALGKGREPKAVDGVRKALDRLADRGKVTKPKRGVFCAVGGVNRTGPDKTGHSPDLSNAEKRIGLDTPL